MAAIHRLWEELNQRIREGDNLQSQMPARTLSTRVGLPCQEMGTARGVRTLRRGFYCVKVISSPVCWYFILPAPLPGTGDLLASGEGAGGGRMGGGQGSGGRREDRDAGFLTS